MKTSDFILVPPNGRFEREQIDERLSQRIRSRFGRDSGRDGKLRCLRRPDHRYENVGQFDPEQKQEYEIGINVAVTKRQTIGVSYFGPIQFGAAKGQFSFVKMQYGISF